MKNLLIFVFSIGVFTSANSQEIIFQVITSTGAAFQNSGPTVAFTVGELVVEPLNNDSASLGSGIVYIVDTVFVTSIQHPNLENIEINVFPNPTTERLTIKWTKIGSGISIELFDIKGKQLQREIHSGGTSTSLDISSYAKGIYLLQFKQFSGEVIALYRIQKL